MMPWGHLKKVFRIDQNYSLVECFGLNVEKLFDFCLVKKRWHTQNLLKQNEKDSIWLVGTSIWLFDGAFG
jgi:hypothetical protein